MLVTFQFDSERALAAMAYVCKLEPEGLDTYKMCKLVFLSDKLHLVRYGRTITGDRICAMEHGPVPSETYRILKQLVEGGLDSSLHPQVVSILRIDRAYYYPRISAVGADQIIEELLSDSDITAMQDVVRLHGGKSFAELRALTHEMPAYKHAWESERAVNNPTMAFEDMFEEDGDALAGVREEMIEDHHLRATFGTLV